MSKSLVYPPKKLFALLRYIGIDQNTLAARLGVSHTLVSLWAHGKKPIPEKYTVPILDLVRTMFEATLEPLKQHAEQTAREAQAADVIAAHFGVDAEDYPPVAEFLRGQTAAREAALQAAQACSAAFETYHAMLREWLTELYLLSGKLYQNLYGHCRTLGEYGKRQPHPLTSEERAQIKEALTAGLHHLEYLERLDPTPAALLAELEAHKGSLSSSREADCA